MDKRGKYTDPPLPAEYAWIRPGVPVRTKDFFGEREVVVGLISKAPWLLKVQGNDPGDWCCYVSGGKGGARLCEGVEPHGEVEAVVWCQDCELAPFDIAVVFTLAGPRPMGMLGNEVLSGSRRGDSSWASVNQFGESAIHVAKEIHSWAFPLQGPRS